MPPRDADSKEKEMQVVITARHVSLTPEMKDRIEAKANKLLKYYDRIQRIDAVVEKSEGSASFSVEFVVNAEHRMEFIARADGDDVYAAVDSIIDKLERQLSDHKERFRNRKHPPQ
jgi:putative sigma-54 modulation protein